MSDDTPPAWAITLIKTFEALRGEVCGKTDKVSDALDRLELAVDRRDAAVEELDAQLTALEKRMGVQGGS